MQVQPNRTGHSPPTPGVTASGRGVAVGDMGPVRIFLAGLMLVTISRIHDYVGLVGIVRPGVILFIGVLVAVLLYPRSVNLRNLSLAWPNRVMLGFFAVVLLSAALGLSVGGSGSFILGTYSRTMIFFCLLAITIGSVRDLRFLMSTYVVSTVILVFVVFFVAGARSYGSYSRIGETAMYDANDLCVVFLAGLPLALVLAQSGGRVARLLGWAALAGIPAAILMTASRGGFVGFAAAGLMLLFVIPGISMIRRVGTLAVATAVIAVAAPDGYWGQMSTILHPSQDYNLTEETGRMAIWTRGIGYVAEYPILGVGPDNFIRAGWVLSDQARGIAGQGLRDQAPHNTLLQVWVETGTVGLLLWLAIFFGGTVGLLRIRSRLPDSWLRGTHDQRFLYLTASYIPVGFVGFTVSSFFTSHAYTAMFYVLAAFFGGFLLLLRKESARTVPISGPGTESGRPPVSNGQGPGGGRPGGAGIGRYDPDHLGQGTPLPLPTALGRRR
jgi:O-antigen ligase